MLKRKVDSDEVSNEGSDEQGVKAVQKKLVGTWMLQTFVNKSQEGDKRFPFGENPVGQLYYDNNNRVGVHIMRAERKPIQAATHYDATPEESKLIVNQFFGYCGTYEIDPKEQLVKHHLEAHISPNNVGDQFVRKYEFYGNNELSLTMKNDPNRELTWKKISGDELKSEDKNKETTNKNTL
jgi:hypothetical protein